ncbi:MAG TPA: SDR family oxidoreductase [Solirubrobacteraceae bacterium]|nr:SDR family oxidoreductase [Solirubrobacteraceae bacterium]
MIVSEIGCLDHLVYTAGESLQLGPIADTSVSVARGALELRVWSAFMAIKYAVPHIHQHGSIVSTSGAAGPRPQAGWSVAALICSGMEGLARALAIELAPIRVNVVRPGVVRSDLWNSFDQTERGALYETVGAGQPTGRVGEATEVAASYLYLMASGYSTGSIVTVDGGAVLA